MKYIIAGSIYLAALVLFGMALCAGEQGENAIAILCLVCCVVLAVWSWLFLRWQMEPDVDSH